MPAISVVMPVYNTRPAHLNAAIKSILTQDFTDFEFLILNDSPENKSLKQQILAFTDPRIKYMENPRNLGIAQSYNRLVKTAVGKYTAMMNHDDISAPHRLSRQYAFLNLHPEVALVGTAYKKFGEINRFKTVTPPQNDRDIRAMMLFKSPLHHPTIMFRRRLVFAHNISYNTNYISLNDRQFYYDMGKLAKLANLHEPLYKYRFHAEMTSKLYKPRIRQEQKSFHDMWFQDNGINLSVAQKEAFDEYAATGRCRILHPEILQNVREVLEILSSENTRRKFMPEPEFSNLCARYLVKRCLNAAVYGRIASNNILMETPLPVQPNLLLNVANFALQWKH